MGSILASPYFGKLPYGRFSVVFRVRATNDWVSGVLVLLIAVQAFEQVYDLWVLGPLGFRIGFSKRGCRTAKDCKGLSDKAEAAFVQYGVYRSEPIFS